MANLSLVKKPVNPVPMSKVLQWNITSFMEQIGFVIKGHYNVRAFLHYISDGEPSYFNDCTVTYATFKTKSWEAPPRITGIDCYLHVFTIVGEKLPGKARYFRLWATQPHLHGISVTELSEVNNLHGQIYTTMLRALNTTHHCGDKLIRVKKESLWDKIKDIFF